jgi:uncharacterized Zn finger protein
MESEPPGDEHLFHKLQCPICGIESELLLPPRAVERCVALHRVRCDSCGIERTVFLKFPDEEDVWSPR